MFWTALLIIHGLAAVALLGGLTHQAVAAVWKPRPVGRPRNFVESFAAIKSAHYANSMSLIFIGTFLFGCWVYVNYRTEARVPMETLGQFQVVGLFEIKEHAAALGIGLLPLYWVLWKRARFDEQVAPRVIATLMLALTVWVPFILGHIVNNVRGVSYV